MISITIPQPQPTYIYGEILSASAYVPEENEPPGIWTFLTQGAAVGAFLGFLSPVFGMLLHPENGYNFLLASYLHVFLAFGMAFGVFEGVLLWACTYIVGRRLNVFLRAVIAIVVLRVLLVVYNFLFAEPSSYRENVSTTDYLFGLGIYAAYGLLYGLVVGSKFKPWNEIVRGTTPPRLRVLTGITGFALRIVVIFGLMQAVLFFIWTVQRERDQEEIAFTVIGLVHFIAAALILFTRMPFWLLLLLALIINFPIAALITDVLKEEDVEIRYTALGYLHLWAAFLSTRLTVPRVAFSFIKRKRVE